MNSIHSRVYVHGVVRMDPPAARDSWKPFIVSGTMSIVVEGLYRIKRYLRDMLTASPNVYRHLGDIETCLEILTKDDLVLPPSKRNWEPRE